ncbi:putative ATP-dependent RNA helicase [Dirofilaria immitis]
MSGGFGRGRIIQQEVDDSYISQSHITRVNNSNERSRNGNNDTRNSFAIGKRGSSFGSRMEFFPDFNRDSNGQGTNGRISGRSRDDDNEEGRFGRDSDVLSTFNDVGNRRGRIFTRGGRGSAFFGGRMDDNKYSSNHEASNEFSSGFSTERPGEFSSGYIGRSGESRRSSKAGGRGGGFGAGVNLDDTDFFGSRDRASNFTGGRGSSYESHKGFADDFLRPKSCNRGFRGGNIDRGSSGGRGFRAVRSDFNSDMDESDCKFDSQRNGFSSRRGGTYDFDRSYNNDGFGGFGSRLNTEKVSFGARNSGFNSEGRMGFGRSKFNSDWNDKGISGRGNQYMSDLNKSRTNYHSRAFENGAESRPSSHIPEDRPIDEMYDEDAENAKYEISDLDQEVVITGVPELQKLLKLEDWKNAGFGDLLLQNITEKSFFSIPRRIQAAVIPLIQNGWDIVGHAETGSGKTAAFVLPIINHIMNNGEPTNSKCAPIALILAPTRELVGQLYNQTRKFADGTGVTVAKAYGQYKMMENIMELERGCNILFATMGRLKDFLRLGKVKLHNISFFVLDEADRMLSEDSFHRDVMDLIHTPGFPSKKNRQTLLFSATFAQKEQELASKIMKEDHAFVSNGKVASANPLVEQNFIEVTSANKFDKLIELLEDDRANNGDVERTLVFVQRKKMADVIALNLVQKNIRSSSISGDRTQKQREEALTDFRKGNIKVLVATDVCARGIDIKDLQHVINYDMPNDRITYVHRIGRTGRLHRGKATSFINRAEQDSALIADIIQVVREVQQIPPDFLLEIANNRMGYAGIQRSGW